MRLPGSSSAKGRPPATDRECRAAADCPAHVIRDRIVATLVQLRSGQPIRRSADGWAHAQRPAQVTAREAFRNGGE
jgi:hypothetical protein